VQRNRRALAVAVLVVVAIALATATLANPATTGSGAHGGSGGGTGISDGSGSGGEGQQDGSLSPGGGPTNLDIGTCIPFLTTSTFYLLTLVALLALMAFVRWRTSTLAAVAIVLAFSAPAIMLHALLTKCGPRDETPDVGSFSPTDIANRSLPISGDQAGGAAHTVTQPPVLLVVFVVGLAALFLLFVRSTGNDAEIEELEEADPETSLGEVADAAGTAADRIEADADVENAVYRAWRDMVTSLDIDSPRTTTPAEFAAAAQDAGMTPADVETLTELFREVRYGGEPVTEERERRALSALREIEAEYGTEDER